MIRKWFCSNLFSIFFRPHPGIRFKKAGECSWVGKAKLLADLLDVEIFTVAKQRLGLDNDITRNPFIGTNAGLFLDDAAKVLGRQTKKMGIVLHLTAFLEMVDKAVFKAVNQLLGRGEFWRR